MLLSNLDTFVDEELLTVEEADATYKRVSFTTVLAEALDGVQFVQETVAEKPQIKKSVLERWTPSCPRRQSWCPMPQP